MKIDRIDHIVSTVNDIEKTIRFYTTVLGMDATVFGENRSALSFGNQKQQANLWIRRFMLYRIYRNRVGQD